jgi:hypothetical protein
MRTSSASKLATLHEEAFDLGLVGLDDVDLPRLLEAHANASGVADPDVVPEVQPDPVTRSDDLFVLGNHRLICGDWTQPAVN